MHHHMLTVIYLYVYRDIFTEYILYTQLAIKSNTMYLLLRIYTAIHSHELTVTY